MAAKVATAQTGIAVYLKSTNGTVSGNTKSSRPVTLFLFYSPLSPVDVIIFHNFVGVLHSELFVKRNGVFICYQVKFRVLDKFTKKGIPCKILNHHKQNNGGMP